MLQRKSSKEADSVIISRGRVFQTEARAQTKALRQSWREKGRRDQGAKRGQSEAMVGT